MTDPEVSIDAELAARAEALAAARGETLEAVLNRLLGDYLDRET